MLLQRIPSGPWSMAIALVRASTAPFDAVYAARRGSAQKPSIEETLMMEPPPARRSSGSACLVHRKTLRTLTAMTWSHWVTDVSSTRASSSTAALLTSTSRRPNARSTSCIMSTTSCSLLTSPASRKTSPETTGVVERLTVAMRAPSRWNRSAIARPIPRDPPVMSATLPASGSDRSVDGVNGIIFLITPRGTRRLRALLVPVAGRSCVRTVVQAGEDLVQPFAEASQVSSQQFRRGSCVTLYEVQVDLAVLLNKRPRLLDLAIEDGHDRKA